MKYLERERERERESLSLVESSKEGMEGIPHPIPRTVEEVFQDFKGRRSGLIKALTNGTFSSSSSTYIISGFLFNFSKFFLFLFGSSMLQTLKSFTSSAIPVRYFSFFSLSFSTTWVFHEFYFFFSYNDSAILGLTVLFDSATCVVGSFFCIFDCGEFAKNSFF